MRRILGEGRFLRLVDEESWEYVERTNARGVVAIVAVTPDGKLLLTEQYRRAVAAPVIDLPAGLAGDIERQSDEDLAVAAARELEEETGYRAGAWERLTECPTSPGMSGEIVTFYFARGLERCGDGGGEGSERIVVHAVARDEAAEWLRTRQNGGALIDAKVYAGLYFAGDASSHGSAHG